MNAAGTTSLGLRRDCYGADHQAAPRSVQRPGLWLGAMCLTLFGYAVLGKGWAYVGYPPIFIGELLLVGGLAAVLGAKNLKAVLVKGSGGVRIADPRRLRELLAGLYERLEKYDLREAAAALGMIGAWPLYAAQLLPHGATEKDLEEMTERFGPQAYLKLKKRRISCPSCFLADKDELFLPSTEETVYSTSFLNAAIIGCALGMKDAEEAASTLALLDDLGLDFMTLSWQAAYLLELQEHGILAEKDAEGIPLARGAGILRELALRVARRRGEIGEAFARGETICSNSMVPSPLTRGS
jgi:aldehyde:ferredoxin oxidoreductase